VLAASALVVPLLATGGTASAAQTGSLVSAASGRCLDVTNQASVSALIQRVCRSQNVAVLLVAHDVNPILPYLDRVLYLAHGGAVIGTPEQVITAETLSRLYDTPIDVLRDRTGRLVVVGQPDSHAGHEH